VRPLQAYSFPMGSFTRSQSACHRELPLCGRSIIRKIAKIVKG